MIVIGVTGGVASGKSTVARYLKNKGFKVHDSDAVVKEIYAKPTPAFIKYLNKIGLGDSVKTNKINKKLIREEFFFNNEKKLKLENYLHKEVKKSRDLFLKKNKKTKIVFLDIPLLFEKGLDKLCDYVFFLYSKKLTRKKRALKRPGMNSRLFEKIFKTQLKDSVKKKKSNFIINTDTNKNKTFDRVMIAIKWVKQNNA